MKLYTQGAMQDYATGVSLMIQGVLISPSFVYRTELGPATLTADASGKFPDTTLTPYEVASQLGFLLQGSIPDDQAIAAADNGSLATANGLSAQIDRLLATATVKANLTNVMIDWFNARQMFTKTKDTSLFSALATADQDQATLENDLLTLDAAVRERGSVDERLGNGRRSAQLSAVLGQQASLDAVSGARLPERRADQQHDLRQGHLARFAGARRHADAAGGVVGGVGSGADVDRQAGQVHPRRHLVPGRARHGGRPDRRRRR